MAKQRSEFALRLTSEERSELGTRLRQQIETSRQARRDRDDRIRQWRDQYDGISVPKNFPWPNSANLNVPITRSITDSIHARILRVMLGVQPFFRITPFKGADVPYAKRIEDLLEWQMTTEVELAAKLDEVVLMALRDGNCMVKAPWVRHIRVERDRVELDAKLRELLPGATLADVPDGTHVHIERDEVIKNGPDMIVVDVLDWVMYPHNAKSVERALFCGHRFWKNRDDLLHAVKDGIYDADAVDELLDGAGERPNPTQEQYGGDPDRHEDMGLDLWAEMDEEDRPFEFYEIVCRFDADDDGLAEDCLFVLEMSTGIIVRAETYPYWHGRRCYVNYCPYPRATEFYGYSVPEILEDLSAEVNAIRNQRVDAGTINLSPMLAARRGARYDPNKNRWRPGGVLWLDDPNDVKPLFVQANTQSAFAEEQGAREMAERVSGVSDYAQGQAPSRSRTLGEIQAVLSEGNLKFDVVIQRLQRSNNEFAGQVLGLNRQFLDDETEFAIARGDEQQPIFATVSKEDIARRVGVRAHGNTLNSNKELELQSAEKLYMMSERNPLMQKPTRLYHITAKYLTAMGERNVQPIIGTEEEARHMEEQQAQQPPAGPEPNISGRMDEITTLALLLRKDPDLADDIGRAVQMLQEVREAQTPEGDEGEGEGAPAEAGGNNFATAGGWAGTTPGAGGDEEQDAPPAPGEDPESTGSPELDQMLAEIGA